MFFKKIVAIMFCMTAMLAAPCARAAEYDTSDPLYMNGRGDILSESNISYYDSIRHCHMALPTGLMREFHCIIKMILMDMKTVSQVLIWAENIV